MMNRSTHTFLAAALGLFEPETPEPRTSYSALIQNFNRFILEQLYQECGTESLLSAALANGNPEQDNEASPIKQLFGIPIITQNRCQCGATTQRKSTPFTLDLHYHMSGPGPMMGISIASVKVSAAVLYSNNVLTICRVKSAQFWILMPHRLGHFWKFYSIV
jgi:hypothetical protein